MSLFIINGWSAKFVFCFLIRFYQFLLFLFFLFIVGGRSLVESRGLLGFFEAEKASSYHLIFAYNAARNIDRVNHKNFFSLHLPNVLRVRFLMYARCTVEWSEIHFLLRPLLLLFVITSLMRPQNAVDNF